MEAAFGLRILREQVPGPRERVGRRLVAGEEERHRLVAQLLVGHTPAVALLVHGQEEHREQVAAVTASPPALLDDAVDDAVEPRACALEAAALRERQLLQKLREREHQVAEEVHHLRERRADLVGVRLDVGVEERLADDRERESHHLFRDVERLAVAPARRSLGGELRHHARVGAYALPVEGGLGESPLAAVELALARQKPFAQETLGALQRAPLVEAAVVRDEDVADVFGVVQ